MKEEDIRPYSLIEKQKKYIQEDIEFLLKQRDKFEFVDCLACETNNKSVEFEKNGFSYIECSNCGMLYMSPRPSVDMLSKFYQQSPNYKFFNDYIFPASREVRKEKIFIPRVKKVIEISKKNNIVPNKILEIGSGFGLFCEEMAKTKHFKEVIGVEASDSLHATCLEKGFRIYNGILEKLTINEKFNIVVAYEVLEHIYNPYSFLKIIHGLLVSGGMIMLTFPHYNGFDIGMLREQAIAIDHEHLNYFNEQSISILFNRVGFQLKEVQTPGQLDVDLVKSAFETGIIKNSFIQLLCSDKYATVRESFQQFLAENKLSSHMLLIARRL